MSWQQCDAAFFAAEDITNPQQDCAGMLGLSWTPTEWNVLQHLFDGQTSSAFSLLRKTPTAAASALLACWCVVIQKCSTACPLLGIASQLPISLSEEEKYVVEHFRFGSRHRSSGAVEAHWIVTQMMGALLDTLLSREGGLRPTFAWDTHYKALQLAVGEGRKASFILVAMGTHLYVCDLVLHAHPSQAILRKGLEAVRNYYRVAGRPAMFLDHIVHAMNDAMREEELRDLLQACDAYRSALNQPLDLPLTFSNLHTRFVGQAHVVSYLNVIFTQRQMNVVPQSKPLVLWFFGLSGHGKSALARWIATILHCGADASDPERTGKFITLHMPNFCTKESAYSLIDPPTAHVGDGILLSKLQHGNDDAVVLLDEFEKVDNQTVSDIWLSAFQKDGMLRSLKAYDRSVSTVRTVFILTSNTCQDVIARDKEGYLAALSEGHVEALNEYINRWTSSGIETVKKKFGEPLTNRVDKFIVFVPYSDEEKITFVQRELQELSRYVLKVHGRTVMWAPSAVCALVQSVPSFHSAEISQRVSPVLAEAQKKRWSVVAVTSYLHQGRDILKAVSMDGSSPETKGEQTQQDAAISRDYSGLSPVPRSEANVPCTATKDIQLDRDISQLSKTVELEQEVERLRDVVRRKDVEIARLTDLILTLETALGYVTVLLVVSLLFLTLFLSLQSLLFLLLMAFALLALCANNVLQIVAAVVRGLYRVLGPRWFWFIVMLVACRAYLSYSGNMPSC